MKKNVTLYNVLFPFWMLLLFPQVWLFVLPGNFIIDSIVLVISMFKLKFNDKIKFYKNTILKIFAFGIISDIIGSIYMLIMTFGLEIGKMGDEWYLTVPALIISSICIFDLNYRYSFKMCDKKDRMKLSLIFAIATAPYTFLIPSSLLYANRF